LPFGLITAAVDREWKNWERWALLLGAAFGTMSYFIQAKGYAYHRYALVTFALLWMAIELSLAIRRPGWVRHVGVAGMVVGVLLMVPVYAHRVLLVETPNEYTNLLERDLTRLGGDSLQQKVQCLDLVDGCLNALYHLRLVQSTGATGDLLFFAPDSSPVVDFYRDQFWGELTRKPPTVIVLSNEWFNGGETFDKIDHWPNFAAYLNDNFDMVVDRRFDLEEHHAYRIYVRKGVPVPSLAASS
jgi:hypothetical protein